MDYYSEKIFFAVCSLVSTALFSIAAVLTEGDVRWILITTAVSVMTASFLSLAFRKAGESIRIVLGRSGMTILSSIMVSKAAVMYFNLNVVTEDVILVGAAAFLVSILTYFPGHGLFKSLDDSSTSMGNAIRTMLVNWLTKSGK